MVAVSIDRCERNASICCLLTNASAERLSDLPMMPERAPPAPYNPPVPLPHGPYLFGTSRHGLRVDGRRIGTHQHQARRAAMERLRTVILVLGRLLSGP